MGELAMIFGFLGIFLFFRLFQDQAQEYFSLDLSSLQTIIFPLLVIFGDPVAKLFRKPFAAKAILITLAAVFSYGFVFFPELTRATLLASAKTMIIFMPALVLFNKLINFYVDSEAEAGKKSFPMAFWIFFGTLFTLFLKGSVLSLILRMVYPAPFP